MPTEPSPSQWEQIEAEIFAGHKIQAIKLLREATGGGLAEAKQAVEQHETALRSQHPEKFTAQGKGCGTAVLMLVLAISTAVVMITQL
ncbi:MAG: ribosomal protein L7/L12 [Phycisphaeraceae bacterium]